MLRNRHSLRSRFTFLRTTPHEPPLVSRLTLAEEPPHSNGHKWQPHRPRSSCHLDLHHSCDLRSKVSRISEAPETDHTTRVSSSSADSKHIYTFEPAGEEPSRCSSECQRDLYDNMSMQRRLGHLRECMEEYGYDSSINTCRTIS